MDAFRSALCFVNLKVYMTRGALNCLKNVWWIITHTCGDVTWYNHIQRFPPKRRFFSSFSRTSNPGSIWSGIYGEKPFVLQDRTLIIRYIPGLYLCSNFLNPKTIFNPRKFLWILLFSSVQNWNRLQFPYIKSRTHSCRSKR